VAALGHHHFKVEKNQSADITSTQIFLLNKKDKVLEIARMLGGVTITENTLVHAEEMLEHA
jgi:DNA repair protein RecN (Recombination protein N)